MTNFYIHRLFFVLLYSVFPSGIGLRFVSFQFVGCLMVDKGNKKNNTLLLLLFETGREDEEGKRTQTKYKVTGLI